jgi:hypothetical protein
VIDYYTKGLNASGWKIDASAELAGYWVITAKKDTRSFFAYISEADGNLRESKEFLFYTYGRNHKKGSI